MSVVADGANRNIFVPFEEYVCCHAREYSGSLTGSNAVDAYHSVIQIRKERPPKYVAYHEEKLLRIYLN
jgi:hypothetical protein